MQYYFPSPIQDLNFPKTLSPELKETFNSGKSALKVALRTLSLPAGSKIAIPAYVCPEVKESVREENFESVLFDLKNDKTFWAEYDTERIKKENIKAIILVHLYGFVHPDTQKISELCEKENIFLIHDAAQSYGIDENKLKYGEAIIYSFGAGKATTAAGGGWIKDLKNANGISTIKKSAATNFQNAKAIFFLKSRIYGYQLSGKEKLAHSISNFVSGTKVGISEMSPFQKQAASQCIAIIKEIAPVRKRNYLRINEKLTANKNIKMAYDDAKGIYFKAILFIENEPGKFREYLQKNNIPFFSLFNEEINNTTMLEALPNFKKYAANFVEISTESVIPEMEIKRVEAVLATY